MKPFTASVFGGTGGDAASGEIGGNKILLEFDEKAYFLDFGTSFARNGRYFDEFLSPRAAVGLRDFLAVGLLPPIEGIYRHDLTLHEPGLWEKYRAHPQYRRVEHLDGILLTHAHQDHNGCLGFLKPEIPIYTGLMTALIGKAMQDIGGGGPEAQFCYMAPKELNDDGLLKAVTGHRVGRPHYIPESDPAIRQALTGLVPFFQSAPGKRTTYTPAPFEHRDLEPEGIKFFRVDHSIPGSGAWAIKTPIGWVGYTGDLRLHGHSGYRTKLMAEQMAALKPALLIAEGTNLTDKAPTTEQDVKGASLEAVKRATGLVVADFSARNIERLRTFHEIAQETGRRLVVTTKDAYLLDRMHVIDPKIPAPGQGVGVLRTLRATVGSWEAPILDGQTASLVDSATIRSRPGDYILCLSYWDITNLIDIEPKGGTYIYSSSEARTEEQRVDQERLGAWLDLWHLKRVGGLPGAETGPFHASGHIDGAGMEWLIETIRPERILPVHTQKREWFEQRWGPSLVA